jgi:hypothetical protein
VLDKYDPAPHVLNEDVIYFKPVEKYDAIISISTLEHVGWDEDVRDPAKFITAVRNLTENCLAPGGCMLVTVPLGYNTYLDDNLAMGADYFNEKYFLKRVSAKKELRVFEELTPDPRAGGFGPLYSTALLLAGVGCLMLIFRGGTAYWPGWFLFLGTVASSFGSQVWWARWTPQNWLIVIAFLMTILASPTEGKTFKGVRALAVLAAGLNVLLITLYYFVGMIKQEKILNRQIELASSLKNPVPIYIPVIKEGHNAGASFVASEWWFVDRGAPVTKLEKEPIRPRMRIHKTATYIPLPNDWRLSLKSPKDEELFRKKGLIED